MNFVIMLVVACLFAAVAARSIRATPWLWYAVALAFDAVYAYGIVYSLPPAVLQVLSHVVQRGTFAAALFVIVMYCGVFPEHSAVRRRVGPVRAELSVIACILAFAHCLNYLDSYVGVLSRNIGAIGGNQLVSLALALVLFALLIVLGATSAQAVKRRMKSAVWKGIQRSAYVFFGLIYLHELLVLYPSAVRGSGDALATCVAGGVVFAGYYVLRFARYRMDRKKERSGPYAGFEGEEANGAYSNQA